MDPNAEKLARNEALFREVNERVRDVTYAFETSEADLVCECGDPTCLAPIAGVRLDEYEAVRRAPARFILRVGHDDPRVERVVEETDRFIVVEKLGEGADIARELDPRG